MSYQLLERPRSPRVARRIIFAGGAVAIAAALIAGWLASRPVVVTADGIEHELAAGATVAMLRSESAFTAAPGDVLGIDGSVVATGGGEPYSILINGRPASLRQALRRGDILVSRDGADLRESVVVTETPIAFPVVYQGKGSLLEERRAGVPGLRRITLGELSGIEVSSTIVKQPRAAVIQRFHPKPGTKIVALTFDDGPWPKWTAAVLDALERENVPATFFVLGVRVKMRPDVARRIADEGHQIASHSWGHRDFTKSKPAEIKRQIRKSRSIIKATTGVDSRWMRAPYGSMNTKAWKTVGKERMKVVGWDVDSGDWTKPGAKKIATNVVKRTKPGSIVLMHDGGGNREQTVKALPMIIKQLRKKGYTFVTVEELYAVRAAAKDPDKK